MIRAKRQLLGLAVSFAFVAMQAGDAEARKGRPLPAPDVDAGVFLDGTDDTIGGVSIALAGVQVTVNGRPTSDGTTVPVFTITAEDQEPLEIVGEETFFGFLPITARIAQFDPSTRTPEVIVTSYTGGAHCCDAIWVVSINEDGAWQTEDMGAFDGGYSYEDANGDGVYELAVFDQSFFYTFDCYACSWPPKMYLQMHAGDLLDVSSDVSFRPAYEAEIGGYVPEQHPDQPGRLAGWAALEARLGRGEEALQRLAAMNAVSDLTYEICQTGEPAWACTAQAKREATFLEFLRAHLFAFGYMEDAG
ncbi:MAG: hypothetical protein AAF590_08145 [Pseudomonadota bacterium]